MENERGFHHRGQVNFEKGGSGQSAMPPHGAPAKKHMAEPTNHAGHTHEMARRHESDARIEGHRAVHAGGGQRDHERILHDTHKLHQGDGFVSHGNKHGESVYYRAEHESAAEREREGE
jgi:hypothetical protein